VDVLHPLGVPVGDHPIPVFPLQVSGRAQAKTPSRQGNMIGFLALPDRQHSFSRVHRIPSHPVYRSTLADVKGNGFAGLYAHPISSECEISWRLDRPSDLDLSKKKR
jgi:hypothetical protein